MAGLNDCLGIPVAGSKPPAIITLVGARGSARASTNTQAMIFTSADSRDANGGMEYVADSVFGDYVVVKRDGYYYAGVIVNVNTAISVAIYKNPSNAILQNDPSSNYGAAPTFPGSQSYILATTAQAASTPTWVSRTTRLQAGDRIYFVASTGGGTNANLVQAVVEYLGGT